MPNDLVSTPEVETRELLLVRLASVGATVTDSKYLSGMQRRVIQAALKWGGYLILLVMGVRVKVRKLRDTDVDYSFYLGPDYRGTAKPPPPGGRVSKYISPHVSILDVLIHFVALDGDVSFAAGAFVGDVPLIGDIAKKIGCVFVPRSGSKEVLGKTMDSLMNRFKLVEETSEFPPVMIFPEGTCSNNLALLKFRRGAFYDLRCLTPVCLKVTKFGTVFPALDVIDEFT